MHSLNHVAEFQREKKLYYMTVKFVVYLYSQTQCSYQLPGSTQLQAEPTPSIAVVGKPGGGCGGEAEAGQEDGQSLYEFLKLGQRSYPYLPGPYIDTRLSRWVPMGNPWAPTHQIMWG
ncbi:hypothetical protein R3P38DRAFT_2770566 [Favolaschia claudopus]|uniref:Uncharacterized protein n=1 Tax=Favolaschia claudopus TaxID=2862362 RepID=A0AAW0CH36_9AGAR